MPTEEKQVLERIPWAGGLITPEDEAYFGWGARAIWGSSWQNPMTGQWTRDTKLDFVHDRKGVACADDSVELWDGNKMGPELDRFNRLFMRFDMYGWLQDTLDLHLQDHPLDGSSREVIELRSPAKPFVGRMTPNGSHGYMYCALWLTKEMWDMKFKEIGEEGR